MRRRVLAAALFVSAAAVPARAQQSDGLATLLLRFFSPTRPVVLQEAAPPFSHAAHFVSQPNAQAILRELNRGIATQISTFPLGSSSPGFTYTFDPSAGVFNRSADSFGPVFAERPLTAGKKKFSFGVSNLSASYDRLEGQKLREDDLQLYLTHQDVNADGLNTNPWFEGDLIRADLSLDITANTTVLFANYGVSDRLDIGLALPLQSIDLDARIRTTVDPVSTGSDPFVVHSFPGGSSSADFTESGDASGLGDVVVRGKYNFMRKPSVAMAAAVDLRLPTGKEEDLLGSGATQAKLYLIAGGAAKRFSPRASVGYTFSSGGGEFTGDLPNEASYSAGFDLGIHPRVTLTADILGRTLFDTGRIVEEDRSFNYALRPPSTVMGTVTRQTVVADTGDLNLLLGAANLKINLVGRLLLNAGALFGLGDSGLQDKVTPVFGIDYSF
jgi:hypothetical protein